MDMATPRQINLSQEQASDLATLWQKAVEDYARNTKTDLSQMRVQSMQDVMSTSFDKQSSFSRFRNKGSTSDKMRDSLGKQLGSMQKCLDGIQMVGAAAAVFPPAMPVTLVFAACGRILGAFAGVKADFDQIEGFLSMSSRFFDRLSIIEGTKCADGALGAAIVRVFSAQLKVYAIVQSAIDRKSVHIKKFFEALWDPRDPDLIASIATMQTAIDELAKAVGFASYAAIKSTEAVTVHISEKTDQLDERIRVWREQQSEDIYKIFEGNLQITMEIRQVGADVVAVGEDVYAVRRTQTIMLENLESMRLQQENFRSQQDKANAQLLKAMERERNRTESEGMSLAKQNPGKGDVSDKRFKALRTIKQFFNDGADFRNWSDAQRENAAQQKEISDAFIKGTGSWVVQDSAFHEWVEGKSRVLWLKGADGIGKSFLAHAATQHLQQQGGGNAVAYFYFREDFPYLQSVQNAVASTVLQVAESKESYAKHISKLLGMDGDDDEEKGDEKDEADLTASWERFFLSVFNDPTSSSGEFTAAKKLFLIFDGLDEIPNEQLQVFMQFLTDLNRVGSRVRLLVTSRPELESMDKSEPLVIDASKVNMLRDIRKLTWHRLNTFERLRKFSAASKKTILRKIAKQADGMLYVEHMIRRLSYIGREGAVLKDLEKLPAGLHDLYKYMLDDCRRNRSVEQYEALKRLFAWLAFSKRPLSLAEASELITMNTGKGTLDIEDEIIGRSARILELSRTSTVDEDNQDDIKDEDDDDQDDYANNHIDDYRTAPLTFQERSLRQYFRALSMDQHGDEELRTPAKRAQLTIFSMSIEVLFFAAESFFDTRAPELRNYAAQYWYEHFNELVVDDATDEEVIEVVNILYKLLTNQSKISDTFDRYADSWQLYPEREEDEPQPWYDRVQSWLKKAIALPETSFSTEFKEWAMPLAENDRDLLIPLAQGHIDNWFYCWDVKFIMNAYTNALRTLTAAGKLDDIPEDSWDSVIYVSKIFDPDRDDVVCGRAIGIRAFKTIKNDVDDERNIEIQRLCLSAIAAKAEVVAPGTPEQTSTYMSLAAMHAELKEHDKAISILKEAVTAREANAEVDTDRKAMPEDFETWNIYQAVAWRLDAAERFEEAAAAYDRARVLFRSSSKHPSNCWWICDQITILKEKLNDDSQIIEAMKSWNDKERCLWFNRYLYYWSDSTEPAMDRVFRSAKATGQTGLVLEWFETLRKAFSPYCLVAAMIEATLGEFHDKVLEDADKAKLHMRKFLQMHPKYQEAWEEDVMYDRISAIRLDLAAIIFSQFSSSYDPARKEELMTEMRNLPGTKYDDDFRESHVGMLIANMLRKMGPTRDYQSYMNKIFDTCIAGLEDTDAFNDSDSLRLLTKLLSSLDGLERDARITISAQFSILDKELFDKAVAGSDSGEATADATADAEKPAEGGATTDADKMGESILSADSQMTKKEEAREAEKVPRGEEEDRKAMNGSATVVSKTKIVPSDAVVIEETAPASPSETEVDLTKANGTIQGSLAAASIEIAEKQEAPTEAGESIEKVDVEPAEQAKTNGNVVKPAEGEAAKGTAEGTVEGTADPEVPERDEDISEYYIGCDGACGASIENWSEPFYLCLICPNTDLCVACHEKRLQSKSSGESISWKRFCAPDHQYIRAPMKGWKGVKDGVIRIEGEEEFTVKEWIKGLREERWPKAWERYWLKLSGLKSIESE